MLKTACGNGFPLNIPSVIPESGGSGGTSDYSELSNKPQINSVTLSGNKSAADIGLATAADLPGLATTSAAGLVQPDGTSITIEDGIISATGGGGGSGETYSETETKIGTWLGHDLYRKVIDTGTLPNNSEKRVSDGISGNIRVIHLFGSAFKPTNGEVRPLPFASDDFNYVINTKYLGNTGTDAHKVYLYSKSDYSDFTSSYMVLEYIKL